MEIELVKTKTYFDLPMIRYLSWLPGKKLILEWKKEIMTSGNV